MAPVQQTLASLQRLSPSALDRYRTCPRRFLWQDVERRPVTFEPSPGLFVGNAVHQALSMFLALQPPQRTLEELEATLRGQWLRARRATPGVFTSRAEEAHHGQGALEMLRRYFATRDLTQAQPVARERPVRLDLADGTELVGRVDRIDELPGGGLEVIDYKTGRSTLDPDDLRWEPAAQIYLLPTEQTLRQPVERVRFVYLDSGEEPCWEPEREDIPAIAERLERHVANLRTDSEFFPAPGWPCRYCPFTESCPDAGGA